MEETQDEEREVLRAIYDGDANFKEISSTCFQYKYGQPPEENQQNEKAFLLEISWPEDYPSELPTVSLDTFFNKHLSEELKEEIKSKIIEQAEELKDSPMTYSLFDWMNESCQEFIEKISEFAKNDNSKENSEDTNIQATQKPKERKEILTKAQKRRITDRTNFKGERERGWDWVDIVKHLCQTANR